MMFKGIACASLMAMSACVAEVAPVPPPEPLPVEDSCGAAGLQGLIGQRQSVLAAMTFPAATRIIQPGMAVTADYSATRLNIWIGKDGRIARLTCE